MGGDSIQVGGILPAVGDVDGDGAEEPEDQGTLVAYGPFEGTGQLTDIGVSVSGAFGGCLALLDFDGDGRSDLVAREYSVGARQVSLMYGPIEGSVTAPEMDATFYYAWPDDSRVSEFGNGCASAGDVDGDGHQDLLIGDDDWGLPAGSDMDEMRTGGSTSCLAAEYRGCYMPATFRPVDIASAIRAAREAAATSITLSTATSMEGELDGTDVERWLHAVDDGGSELVVSWVGQGSIRMAHTDPSAGVDSSTGKWAVADETVVVDRTIYDVKNTWHIFASGYHWISFSVDSAEDLYVVALDTSFSAVFWPPAHVIGLLGSGALVELENNVLSVPNYNTNDHFLVSRIANGVEIGVRYTNASGKSGHYVVRLDNTGALVNELEFVNSATNHSNLASVDRVPGTWPGTDGAYTMERQVLAPSAIADADSLTENELLLIRTRNNGSASAFEVLATWALQVDGNDAKLSKLGYPVELPLAAK